VLGERFGLLFREQQGWGLDDYWIDLAQHDF
jgi:hypothetical protein